jgi:CPA1 family monovalent cation:H+ antiporter
MAWNVLDETALLLAITAGFAYLNHYALGLPRNVGLLVIAAGASLLLRLVDAALPALGLGDALRRALGQVDFAELLLDGFLAFLLFAGALDVDVAGLWSRRGTILALATVGVLLSTIMLAAGMWAIFGLVGIAMPFAYCLAFGALISPTDPVTVLNALRGLGVSPRLQAVIAGESLFNDGIGIVLYTIFLHQATGGHPGGLDLAAFVLDFLREAGGGVVLGLATGGLAFAAMRGIDEYNIELIISLALVTGTYGLGQTLGVSGPVAVVVAGLVMGSIGVRYAVSGTTLDYLSKFWSLTDEVLNALLFLLIGVQLAAIRLDASDLTAAALAIPLALLVRAVSVAVPAVPLNLSAPHKSRAVMLLTWSGLRGGISVALALSLPPSQYRDTLVTAGYAVVIFTMLVQGLSLRRVAGWLYAGR